jgi:hypothetical protein
MGKERHEIGKYEKFESKFLLEVVFPPPSASNLLEGEF